MYLNLPMEDVKKNKQMTRYNRRHGKVTERDSADIESALRNCEQQFASGLRSEHVNLVATMRALE